jgi:hypothetical protein
VAGAEDARAEVAAAVTARNGSLQRMVEQIARQIAKRFRRVAGGGDHAGAVVRLAVAFGDGAGSFAAVDLRLKTANAVYSLTGLPQLNNLSR